MGSKFIWYGKHIHYTYRMQLPPCHGDYPVWLCSHPARKSQWLVCNRDVGFAGMLCLIRYASPWIWNASVTRIAQKPICAIWGVGVSERCWRYFMILQVNAMAANTLLPYITLWTCNHYDDPMGLIVTRNIQYAKYQVSLVLRRLWFGIGGWNLLFTWDNQTKMELGLYYLANRAILQKLFPDSRMFDDIRKSPRFSPARFRRGWLLHRRTMWPCSHTWVKKIEHFTISPNSSFLCYQRACFV